MHRNVTSYPRPAGMGTPPSPRRTYPNALAPPGDRPVVAFDPYPAAIHTSDAVRPNGPSWRGSLLQRQAQISGGGERQPTEPAPPDRRARTRDLRARGPVALRTPPHKAGTGSGSRRSTHFLSAEPRASGPRPRARERGTEPCRIRTRQEKRFVISRGGVSRYPRASVVARGGHRYSVPIPYRDRRAFFWFRSPFPLSSGGRYRSSLSGRSRTSGHL